MNFLNVRDNSAFLHGSDQRLRGTELFDGIDRTKCSQHKQAILEALAKAKVLNASKFADIQSPTTDVYRFLTRDLVEPITVELASKPGIKAKMQTYGLQLGDPNLSRKEAEKYLEAKTLELERRHTMVVAIMATIKPQSTLDCAVREAANSQDPGLLIKAITSFYEAKTMATLLAIAAEHGRKLQKFSTCWPGNHEYLEEIARYDDGFTSMFTRDELDRNKEKINELKTFCTRMNFINSFAKDEGRSDRFIQDNVRTFQGNPLDFDVSTFWKIYREYIDTIPIFNSKTESTGSGLEKKTRTNPNVLASQVIKAIKGSKKSRSARNSAFKILATKFEKESMTNKFRNKYPKGKCYQYVETGQCTRPNCKFIHEKAGNVKNNVNAASARIVEISDMFSGPSHSEIIDENQQNDPFKISMLSLHARETMRSPKTPLILLDGGSTDIVLNSQLRHCFKSFRSIKGIPITGIHGIGVNQVIGIGVISFMGVDIEAFYSPNLDVSIISDSVLTDRYKFSIVKIQQEVMIKSPTGLVTKLFKKSSDGRYFLDIHSLSPKPVHVQATSVKSRVSNELDIWHRRFGHYNKNMIMYMATKDRYKQRGLKLSSQCSDIKELQTPCRACLMGKATFSRLKIPNSANGWKKGQLWFFDVSGGGDRTESLIHRNRYRFEFVDACTGFLVSMYDKTKDDKALKKVITKFDTKVLAYFRPENEFLFLHADNAELRSTESMKYLSTKRVLQRFTNPYTPQQNGKVERMHRTVDGLISAMLISEGLPSGFWQWASEYATLIVNITPSKVHGKIVDDPWYQMFGVSFSYHLLRIFGSRAYITDINADKKDYGARALECIFIGFSDNLFGIHSLQHLFYYPRKQICIKSGYGKCIENITGYEKLGVHNGVHNGVQPQHIIKNGVHQSVQSQTECHDVTVYQKELVGEVIFDPEDKIYYKIIKVYSHKGMAVVDRVPHPRGRIEKIDTVYLGDILSMRDLNPIPNESQQEDPKKIVMGKRGADHAEKSQRRKSPRLESRAQLVSAASAKIHESCGVSSDGYAQRVHERLIDWALGHTQSVSDSLADVPNIRVLSLDRKEKVLPKTHDQAMGLPERREWLEAESTEIQSLNDNKWAEIVPKGSKIPINLRWVYAIKYNAKGELMLYKARLVVRGDLAKEGIDYFETYSPVAKIHSIRMAIALIIHFGLIPLQVDISSAYLHAPVDEEIYVNAPPGYPVASGYCYRLLKSLYGLPQAGRNWNRLVDAFIRSLGFKPISQDTCIYIYVEKGELKGIFAIYVDDFIIGAKTKGLLEMIVNELRKKFKTKVIGVPSLILGISIYWKTGSDENNHYYDRAYLTIEKSISTLLQLLKVTKERKIPANPGVILSKDMCPEPEEADLHMQKIYRSAVGLLIWIQHVVRVDISHAVFRLTRFMTNPGFKHYLALEWIAGYLKYSIRRAILYRKGKSLDLRGYVDSDHGTDPDTRRSTYSYLFTFCGSPISWKTGQSTRVCIGGTCESEIRAVYAMREGLKEMIYLKKYLTSLGFSGESEDAEIIASASAPFEVMEDNSACIRFSEKPQSATSLKFLELDIFWINEVVRDRKEVKLVKVESKNQLANHGTKNLDASSFESEVSRLMVWLPDEF